MNPEIGMSITTGLHQTNYHDVGSGETIVLLHGSGPGVSAWANWRLTIGALSDRFRLVAPDLAGFGYTQSPADYVHSMDGWVQQVVDFLDAMGITQAHLIGNSFGGSLALAMAIRHPERIDRLVLMGAAGVRFDLTEGLDAVWGYEPSAENMRRIMEYFAYDQSLVGPDLVQMRYEASARPGVQEAFSSMFPAPRQRWVDALAHAEADVRGITKSTLIVHGRDDQVIPLQTSQTLLQWIDDSQLHVFGRCGHWTQIEHADAFNALVAQFLSARS